MTAHAHYKSAETAAQSPAARWLRRKAGVNHLFSFRRDSMARDLGYGRANAAAAVGTELRRLKQASIIEFVSESGPDAITTVRVLR